MTRLLLLTNDFPFPGGDTTFVEKEIDYLAQRFDSVIVFNYAREPSRDLVELPPGVSYGGNLWDRMPEDWHSMLQPRALAQLVRAARLERRSARLEHTAQGEPHTARSEAAPTTGTGRRNTQAHRAGLFVRASLVGMRLAHRRSLRTAIAGDPDTVVYAFWGMGAGLALPWLRELPGVSGVALRLHRFDLYEEQNTAGYLPLRRALFAASDRVLCISDDALGYLLNRYPDARLESKAALSRLGTFGPEEVSRPPRGPEALIVSVSAVTDVKRVGLILDALVELSTLLDGKPVRWVHFGDGPLFGQLQARVTELRESGMAGLNIELLGSRPNSEVLDFYARSRVDMFVNASASEGIPVSMMEAASYGIPIVATAVGGTPEIVGRELGTGELVSEDASAIELAQALATVVGADNGIYHPRELWSRDYDAHCNGPHAAELVAELTRRHPST